LLITCDIIRNEIIEILTTMGYEQRTWWCCVLDIRLYVFIILKQPNIGMRMEPQTLGFFCWCFVHFAFDIYHCCVLFHNVGNMLMCSKIIAFTWEFSKTPCGQILVAQATWDDYIQQWGKYGIIAWLWWMQF